MPQPRFDRSQLHVLPLAERIHDMPLSYVMSLSDPIQPAPQPHLPTVARAIEVAHANQRPVIFIMGAHVIKQGASRFVIDLMERGLITHVAMNGAGLIHDYELALIGATTESVAAYISQGQFGLWHETGQLNDLISQAAQHDLGIGEYVGSEIERQQLPYRELSIAAAGARLGIPVTVHVSIGQDIIHEHPNCDGAAVGKASYTDFLILTHSVSQLEGGVMLNVGSAVMGPEVYLKALAMARNVAHQHGQQIAHFTTAVFDLVPLPDDLSTEAKKSDPAYYYRPFKTILVRTVRDGGQSYYISGDHRITIPGLWQLLTHA
ncbi:MAG: hypothetical protein DWI30_02075 [Chloroflexi bacterium]|nr:MAG: hypothetical protein DWI30_02075 [Chloroflexota bacterium]